MKHPLRNTFAALIILLALGGAYLFLYEPRYDGSIVADEGRTLLFAHRGFGNLAPDNSLVGAQIALKNGLDGVDVDAQLTKEGEVVIFHDVSLERFTTGEGRVDAHTLDELKAYDLGDKYGTGEVFEDVRIATFEDFVREVTPEALLMVELKVSSAKDTGIEKRVIETLQKYDAFDHVLISSFNPVVLYRLKKLDPRIRTVFIFQDAGWNPDRVAQTKEEDRVTLPWYLKTEWARRAIRKLVQPDALSINEGVDGKVMNTLIGKGWPVFLWPLNTSETIDSGMKKQPYGIITDEPLLAKVLFYTN